MSKFIIYQMLPRLWGNIDGKNKKIVMDNGDLILIPRRKYNEVIDILNRYIADEKG